MPDDATFQYIYGANDTATSGDDLCVFEDVHDQLQTIWDSGGHDTLDMPDATYGLKIDLREGAFNTIDEHVETGYV